MEVSSSSSSSVTRDTPLFFRCPISMELMEDPVTISTGVTYDRKNIERWFHVYKKTTCPATMQRLDRFDLIPNHTLRCLMSSFQAKTTSSPAAAHPPPTTAHAELLGSLLQTVQSSPFKTYAQVKCLKRLRSAVAVARDEAAMDLVSSGAIEVLAHIVEDASTDEFSALGAAEEAVGILNLLPLSGSGSVQRLTTPACKATMVALLQGGRSDALLHAVTLIQKITRTSRDLCLAMADQDVSFYKSLLDLLTDGVSAAAALDVLTEIMTVSKLRRLRAVEAGAGPVLLEVLPDAKRRDCERLLFLLKLLCECPDGRSAVMDHAMGVAVVSKKMLRVSEEATKAAVKVLWLICSSAGTVKVVDEMMAFGAVKKLLALLQMDCRPSVKDTTIKILRLHSGAWQHYPCLSGELKDYLRFLSRKHQAANVNSIRH